MDDPTKLSPVQTHLQNMARQFQVIPPPSILDIPIAKNPNLASEFYDRLVSWISDFDKSLDQEEVVEGKSQNGDINSPHSSQNASLVF